MKILIFDFEATDKDVETARIIQIAYSIYDEKIKEVYHYSNLLYNSTYTTIDPVAAAITGISLDQLKEYGANPTWALGQFLEMSNTVDFICGHNIRNYDLPLLAHEIDRVDNWDADYFTFTKKPTIDTRFDCPWPEHIDTRKLLYLASEYGYANPMAHSARHDVDATAFLLKQFDINAVIERSKSPDIFIRADVTFDTKELAKERKYSWNGEKKIWVKQIKECDYEAEKEKSKFKTIILKDYKQ